MSRVAKLPISIPKGVEMKIADGVVSVKGPKGSLTQQMHSNVRLEQSDGEASLKPAGNARGAMAITGTMRALLANMVKGVSTGFERKLTLHGVGYRAAAKGKTLNLTLGFSHPVDYAVPDEIEVETPSQTEITVRGMDKQRVGQVAAEIRAYRPPEPYKGKGVRYADERVTIKEAKKK